MAFSAGEGRGGLKSEPNLVPMIDVLLVLLIVFMMIVPASRKTVDLQLPDPNPSPNQPNTPPPDQIVLEVLPNGSYAVNRQPVTRDQLFNRLKEIYDPRPDKIIFVKGDPSVIYQDVIYAMDVARGAGVLVIGVAPGDDDEDDG